MTSTRPGGPFLQAQSCCHCWPSDPAAPRANWCARPRSGTASPGCGSVRLMLAAWQALFPPRSQVQRQQKQTPRWVGSAGHGQTGWTTSYPQVHALQQTSSSPAAVHNCIVAFAPCRACQSVAAASLLPQTPTHLCRHVVSCFVHYAALFPSPSTPVWGPRDFNWRRPNPLAPGRSNSARLPGCRAYGLTGRANLTRWGRSPTCPCLAGRPPHLRTEVPPRSITIAISCPPGSPGRPSTCFACLVCGEPGFSHISGGPSPGEMNDITLYTTYNMFKFRRGFRTRPLRPTGGSASLGFCLHQRYVLDNRAVSRSDRLGQRTFSTHCVGQVPRFLIPYSA